MMALPSFRCRRAALVRKKKEKKGFFKNLFRKKSKEADSTRVPAPPKEEFDFIDADTLTSVSPPTRQSESRKELLAARRKKSADEAATDPAIAPETKKRRPGSGDAVKEDEEEQTPIEGF